MNFSIAEAEKELATLETDIQALQSQTGNVAAEAYLQGKPKLLTDHQSKIDKALARKNALELAAGTLRLRLGVFGQERGRLNLSERDFGRFEALLSEVLSGVEWFRQIEAELLAVPSGEPAQRATVLRRWEDKRKVWHHVPDNVKTLGLLASGLGLAEAARQMLVESGVEMADNKFAVEKDLDWFMQSGSKALSKKRMRSN